MADQEDPFRDAASGGRPNTLYSNEMGSDEDFSVAPRMPIPPPTTDKSRVDSNATAAQNSISMQRNPPQSPSELSALSGKFS